MDVLDTLYAKLLTQLTKYMASGRIQKLPIPMRFSMRQNGQVFGGMHTL